MQIRCPRCGGTPVVSDGLAGQVVNCPACGGQMQLPAAGAPADAGERRCQFCAGSIRPEAVKCPHCQQFLDGREAPPAERDGPDWEHRDRLGWWAAAAGTFKGALFRPVETFGRMALTGYGPAMGYTALCGGIGFAFTMLWQALLTVVQTSLMPGGKEKAMVATILTVVYLGMAVLAPLLAVVGVFVNALIVHAGLMIVGGARQPLESTFRTLAYASSSAQLFAVVPLCGGMVAGVWALVSGIIGLAKVHDISYGKSAVGVLLIPVVLGLVVGCGVVILMFAVFHGMRIK